MQLITSIQNPRVKQAARLREPRQRQKQQRIIIDGAREVSRAIAGGVRLVEVYLCPKLLAGEKATQLDQALAATGAELIEVNEAVFSKLAFGERAEGVVAIAETPQRRLADLALPPAPLVAVLEGVEKPGNLGAILRTADAAGVSAVVVADGGTDLYNHNAIRASLGAIFTLPVCQANAAETIEWLRGQGLAMYTARTDGAQSHAAADFRRACAVVLGSEANGLSQCWHAADMQAIRLPMLGVVDSLNVSATAAILFYEALRQRTA